jgi:hypothetical protein
MRKVLWAFAGLIIRPTGLVRRCRRETRKLVAGLGCVDETPFQRNDPCAGATGECSI